MQIILKNNLSIEVNSRRENLNFNRNFYWKAYQKKIPEKYNNIANGLKLKIIILEFQKNIEDNSEKSGRWNWGNTRREKPEFQ